MSEHYFKKKFHKKITLCQSVTRILEYNNWLVQNLYNWNALVCLVQIKKNESNGNK